MILHNINRLHPRKQPFDAIRVFDCPKSPWPGAENGPLYTCIYSGGQMGKLARARYMQYFVTPGTALLLIYTFQTILNVVCILFIVTPRWSDICDARHSSAIYVTPASPAVTYMGKMCLWHLIYLHYWYMCFKTLKNIYALQFADTVARLRELHCGTLSNNESGA